MIHRKNSLLQVALVVDSEESAPLNTVVPGHVFSPLASSGNQIQILQMPLFPLYLIPSLLLSTTFSSRTEPSTHESVCLMR